MRFNSGKEYILTIFYYFTPIFILADYLFGFNVRVSGLQNYGSYKTVYYIFCLICAFLIYRYEGYSLVIGFIESIINLLILFISFLLPYFTYASIIADGNIQEITFYDSKMVINFMISGIIVIFTFQSSLNRLTNRIGL